mmetsp:Transcript_50034/g.127318  ORF Transcript_50034/g.127318 Transcript_50034/m.127318 type:complete len:245 (+) Transcript_50034:2-736(+)
MSFRPACGVAACSLASALNGIIPRGFTPRRVWPSACAPPSRRCGPPTASGRRRRPAHRSSPRGRQPPTKTRANAGCLPGWSARSAAWGPDGRRRCSPRGGGPAARASQSSPSAPAEGPGQRRCCVCRQKAPPLGRRQCFGSRLRAAAAATAPRGATGRGRRWRPRRTSCSAGGPCGRGARRGAGWAGARRCCTPCSSPCCRASCPALCNPRIRPRSCCAGRADARSSAAAAATVRCPRSAESPG